jgi:transketolase
LKRWKQVGTHEPRRQAAPEDLGDDRLDRAAAGMAHEGALPFATTYAVFASRRAYDFIHHTIAEENLNVKIVCALPGLTSGYGPSHQATEDLALFRAMPNNTVIDPCDAHEIEQAVPAPPFRQIGLPDEFLLADALPTLHDRYGISAEAMSNSIKGWL